MSEVILGLNVFHGDSAACLVVDGKLVAAAEEERFSRLKHWAGFPSEAAKYCLAFAGLTLADVDHVAVNRDPSANLLSKVLQDDSSNTTVARWRFAQGRFDLFGAPVTPGGESFPTRHSGPL